MTGYRVQRRWAGAGAGHVDRRVLFGGEAAVHWEGGDSQCGGRRARGPGPFGGLHGLRYR